MGRLKIYQLRSFLAGLLALLLALAPASANPTSGGYQLFERDASGISTDIQLASLGNFAPPPETVSEYANAPNTGAIGFTPNTVDTAFAGMREGHAIRHLEGDLIPNTGSLQSRVSAFRDLARPILENPSHAAPWRVGTTSGRAFLGEVDGRTVAIVVATDGPRQGRVITAFVPDASQLSLMTSR